MGPGGVARCQYGVGGTRAEESRSPPTRKRMEEWMEENRERVQDFMRGFWCGMATGAVGTLLAIVAVCAYVGSLG